MAARGRAWLRSFRLLVDAGNMSASGQPDIFSVPGGAGAMGHALGCHIGLRRYTPPHGPSPRSLGRARASGFNGRGPPLQREQLPRPQPAATELRKPPKPADASPGGPGEARFGTSYRNDADPGPAGFRDSRGQVPREPTTLGPLPAPPKAPSSSPDAPRAAPVYPPSPPVRVPGGRGPVQVPPEWPSPATAAAPDLAPFWPPPGAQQVQANTPTLAEALETNLGVRVGVPEPEGIASVEPGQQYRILCPFCMGGSSREASLSLRIDDTGRAAVYNCFRATCGESGTVRLRGGQWQKLGDPAVPQQKAKGQPVRPNAGHLRPLGEEALKFFAGRGISAEALERCGVREDHGADGKGVYCPSTGELEIPIAFGYWRDGDLVNVKYRRLGKKEFWQVKGAEKVLYGLDDIKDTDAVVIVEGEIDKLSLTEVGVHAAVSVPDGAPGKVKDDVPDPAQDKKYEYLWNSLAYLDSKTSVILATDNDEPGQALAEELARRLGRERCYLVDWPNGGPDRREVARLDAKVAEAERMVEEARAGSMENGPVDALEEELAMLRRRAEEARHRDAGPRKDANDVLLLDGPETLRLLIDNPRPYPIRGLFGFDDFVDDIYRYYEAGDESGVSTGWASLDTLYRVVPGELTIVTGVPNSGKSEWLDALLVNLAHAQGWTFAMCSMEKSVRHHARQLLEKYVGRPFFDKAIYSKDRQMRRMTQDELDGGLQWISQHFSLIRFEDDALPSVDWVLEKAKSAVLRFGIRGLVIDPYNELDHSREKYTSETEYVSKMLTQLKRFAQHYDVHVWFVVHPRIMRDWRGQAPNLYDISGSAHFVNKTDNGVVVHRVRDPDGDERKNRQVQILIRKVRNKAAGTIGETTLIYDTLTGRYEDVTGNQVALPNDGRAGQGPGGGGQGYTGRAGAGANADAARASAGAAFVFQNGSMVPGAPLTQAQEEDLPDDDDLGMPPGAMRALY